MSGLSEQERDSLTECECGHFANEHSSTGCLATDFSEDWRPVRDDDVCSCTHSPSAITRHAVERIKADAVAAAREDRDTTWKIAVATLMNALDVNGYGRAIQAEREEAWRIACLAHLAVEAALRGDA